MFVLNYYFSLRFLLRLRWFDAHQFVGSASETCDRGEHCETIKVHDIDTL